MAKISRFEDVEAWKMARALTNRIYTLSSKGEFARDFGLRDQMRRAAVSILSNIAEGFDREGNKEFIQFLSHAKGSAAELRAQLYVALDNKYLDHAQFTELHETSMSISRLLSGLMNYLRRSELTGPKFRAKQSGPQPSNRGHIEP